MQPCTCVAPCFDGGEGVGHRDIGIVMRVDADDAVEALAHVGDDLDQAAGERAAVGIAEAEHVGAGVFARLRACAGRSRGLAM